MASTKQLRSHFRAGSSSFISCLIGASLDSESLFFQRIIPAPHAVGRRTVLRFERASEGGYAIPIHTIA